MEFQLSYFKSWKMMLWKCCTQYASKSGKLSSGHRTGKGQFSFQSQRKAMTKNAQTTAQLHSSHMLMDCSMPGFSVLHHLLVVMSIVSGLMSIVSDAIQPAHPLSSPSPPDSIFPSIRVFSNESEMSLLIRWPNYWSFSLSISPSNEHPGLISFRMDWLDLLAVQGNYI